MNYATPVIKLIQDNICLDNKKCAFDATHEVITRLKFIGTVEKDEKINVKNMTIQSNTIFTSIHRMFQQESRDTTLDFLKSTFNRVFEIIKLHLCGETETDKYFASHLINDLQSSINGLKNLQHTYSSDRLFKSYIDMLIQTITCNLLEIKAKKPSLFENNPIVTNPQTNTDFEL
jgi:hypothetical protein